MMMYNHAKAEAIFRKEWEKDRQAFEAAGMSEEQIAAIYSYDRAVFNSDRRYYEHMDDIRFNDNNPKFGTEPDMLLFSMEDWFEVFEPGLCEKLCAQPEIQLQAFYLCRVCGRTQDETSAILLKPQRTISDWVGKIAEIIENWFSDC